MLSVEAMIEAQKHIHGGVAPSGGGVVGGNRELHVSNYARGMLDLRLQISRLRIEYLNQMNTQSTLLAGCGVAMLNSGELTNLDDKAEWDDYSILSYAWIKFFNYLYSASAAVCLAASCWTIYTAMNLITLSIHSTLNGDSVVAITEADQLIETRMAEVRLVFVIALVSLLSATLLMVGALADTAILLICAVIFGFTCWHAVKSDSGTVRVYERYTGLTIQDRWLGASSGGIEQLKELLIPYGMDDARTGRERLHDRADPVIERLMKKMLVGDIMEGIFKKAARGRDLGKASKLSDEECAIALQRFWRRKSAILNQQRGKHVVRTGWLRRDAHQARRQPAQARRRAHGPGAEVCALVCARRDGAHFGHLHGPRGPEGPPRAQGAHRRPAYVRARQGGGRGRHHLARAAAAHVARGRRFAQLRACRGQGQVVVCARSE